MGSPIYAFGSFRLDASRRLLYRGTEVTMVPNHLAQLLLLLIQADGTIIDKYTIAAQIWPNRRFSDANLSQHMYLLRQLLDERARDHAYVITVRGKGYRLAVPVNVVG